MDSLYLGIMPKYQIPDIVEMHLTIASLRPAIRQSMWKL
jgi:hypothetical protein